MLELLVPALLLFGYLWLSSSCIFQKMRDDIPQLSKISDFHLIRILSCYWLCLSLKKKQSRLFLHFLFPFLLLLTWKSEQLFGEVTWKVAKLPTTTLVPAWKKLLLSQSDSLSQVPYQLLTHTQGTGISRGSVNLRFFFNDRPMVAVYTH